MAGPDYVDVPPEALAEVRAACLALPEVHEEPAWTGVRWCVRKRSFAHLFAVDSEAGPVTMLQFRATGDELDVLRHTGHPFFRPGWGTDTVGMVLDGATDWEEVAELVTDSYCTFAPKKLVALVHRPE